MKISKILFENDHVLYLRVSQFTSIFSGTANKTVAASDPAEAPAKAFTTFSNFLPCLIKAAAAPKW